MKTNAQRIVPLAGFFLVALSLTVATPAAMAAKSEIVEMDAGTSALVAREKVKQNTNRRRNEAAARRGARADCGSVDIGNTDNQRQSARSRVNPRNTTIVVTGPIINAANCR